WVAAHRGGALDRIDPATMTLTDYVLVGGWAISPVYAFGSLFVISGARRQVVKVDPVTRQVVATVPCDCDGGMLGQAGPYLAASLNAAVVLYDPTTMKVVRQAKFFDEHGDFLGAWAIDGTNMWLTDLPESHPTKIYRVNLSTLKITLTVPSVELGLAELHGRLLKVTLDGDLVQLDPATGKVVKTWKVGGSMPEHGDGGIDISDDGTPDGVFMSSWSSDLIHVDLKTGAVRRITGLPVQAEVGPGILVYD